MDAWNRIVSYYWFIEADRFKVKIEKCRFSKHSQGSDWQRWFLSPKVGKNRLNHYCKLFVQKRTTWIWMSILWSTSKKVPELNNVWLIHLTIFVLVCFDITVKKYDNKKIGLLFTVYYTSLHETEPKLHQETAPSSAAMMLEPFLGQQDGWSQSHTQNRIIGDILDS